MWNEPPHTGWVFIMEWPIVGSIHSSASKRTIQRCNSRVCGEALYNYDFFFFCTVESLRRCFDYVHKIKRRHDLDTMLLLITYLCNKHKNISIYIFIGRASAQIKSRRAQRSQVSVQTNWRAVVSFPHFYVRHYMYTSSMSHDFCAVCHLIASVTSSSSPTGGRKV